MSDFFPPQKSHRVRIEVPGALRSDSDYGIYMTPEAQEDKIIRVVVDGEVVLKIHPDGTIQGDTVKGHAVVLCDDGPQGMIYVWMCPLCGQPLREGERCNSGIHQGPDSTDGSGPQAMRSIDLVGVARRTSAR